MNSGFIENFHRNEAGNKREDAGMIQCAVFRKSRISMVVLEPEYLLHNSRYHHIVRATMSHATSRAVFFLVFVRESPQPS